MSQWRYFTLSEFACQGEGCCGGDAHMSHDFVSLLDDLRRWVGFPLVVSSGYRCPEHNNRVSSTGFAGPHTTGRAVDLAVARSQAYHVTRIALQMGFTGIGPRQHGATRFMHLDDLTEADGFARPMIWTYP